MDNDIKHTGTYLVTTRVSYVARQEHSLVSIDFYSCLRLLPSADYL